MVISVKQIKIIIKIEPQYIHSRECLPYYLLNPKYKIITLSQDLMICNSNDM